MSLLSLIFRTVGAWGAGKGSNLSAAEVDGNFYAIQLAVNDLINNPVGPTEISNITSDGATFTVYLEDGSSWGPFSLPTATPIIPVGTISASTYTLALADRGKYLRATNAGGLHVVLPPNDEVGIPIGSEFYFRQATTGVVSFEAGSDVVLNGILGYSNATDLQGACCMIKKVATDEWDLSGQLTADVTA